MENYSGINVSSGMGQGLAQVLGSTQSPYLEKIANLQYQNNLATQKREAEKQAKIDQLRASVKMPLMTPQYTELFKKERERIYQAKTPEEVQRVLADLDVIGKAGNSIYTGLNRVGNIVQSQGEDKFNNTAVLDDIVSGKNTLDMTNIFDVTTDYMDKLNSVQKKPTPFDYAKFIAGGRSALPIQQEGKHKFTDPAQVEDVALRMLNQNPQAQDMFVAEYQNLPQNIKSQYKDAYTYGLEEIKRGLTQDIVMPESKGTNISIDMGEKGNPVTETQVTQQKLGLGLNGRDINARVFTYSQPVNVGATTAPADMFMVDQTTGASKRVTGQSLPKISYNQTAEVPVAIKDYVTKRDYKDKDGVLHKKGEVVIAKGQTVDDLSVSDFKRYGIIVETKPALVSVGFDDFYNKYYAPAQYYAPATVASFYNTKGQTPEGDWNKSGIEKTATPSSQKSTGGGQKVKTRTQWKTQ